MRRAVRLGFAIALACLSVACARIGPVRSGGDVASIHAATAVAVSVASEAIHLVDPLTGARRTAVDDLVDFQAGYASWAPDHRRLAYGNSGVFVLDAASGRRRKLVKGASLSMPAYDADGERLVYGDGESLFVSPARKATPVAIRLPPNIAPLAMAWFPGNEIAFGGLALDCIGAFGCVSTDASEIWVVGEDGTGLRQVTRVGRAENPKWSPDGERLLFVRRVERRSELWSVRADGTGAKRLVRARNVVAGDWSPDGARIAVLRRGEEDSTLQLWIGSADGRRLRAVGTPVHGTTATVDW